MKYWIGFLILCAFSACKMDAGETEDSSATDMKSDTKNVELNPKDRIAKRLKDSLAIAEEAMQTGYPVSAEKISARLDALEERDNRVVDLRTALLPPPCTLVDDIELGSILEIDYNLISRNSGNRANKNEHTSSCFYRWSDPKAGAGMILIQMQRNPLPEEIDNWPKLIIDNKKSQGERTMDNQNVQVVYKDWKAVGDGGAYSDELGKYYFRYQDIFLFTIAFNEIPEKKHKKYAKEIGELILKKF